VSSELVPNACMDEILSSLVENVKLKAQWHRSLRYDPDCYGDYSV